MTDPSLGLMATAFDCLTNQSGVGRGLFSMEDVDAVHGRMKELLRATGAEPDGIFCCPHGPDEGCRCRKPSPGLVLEAAERHGIALSQSVMVGDKSSDVEAGRAAGCGVTALIGEVAFDSGAYSTRQL